MERRVSDTRDPLGELKRFARNLGWQRLRRWRHDHDGTTVVWYSAGKADGKRDDLFLQINESPIGQAITYEAAVYAIRYAIVSGWHSMKLTPDGHFDDGDLQRLDDWLHRRWFDTPANRRKYRIRHPECTGWSWGRIGHELAPHIAWK